MKKFLSKLFLGVFAVSMIGFASCGEEEKEDDKKKDGEEEGAVAYVITDMA